MSSTVALAPDTQQRSFGVYARVLATQVLYITPLFWFMELLQNLGWKAVAGSYGWVFPESPYNWFSFASMGLWAGSVGIMWTLHYFWFYPKGVKPWLRWLIAGAVCWGGEWSAGYLSVHVIGYPMQVWPGAALVYVGIPALVLWVGDVVVYQVLTQYLVDLTPGYDVPGDT